MLIQETRIGGAKAPARETELVNNAYSVQLRVCPSFSAMINIHSDDLPPPN